MTIKVRGLEVQYELSDGENTLILTVDLAKKDADIQSADWSSLDLHLVGVRVNELRACGNLILAAAELADQVLNGRRHWENVTEHIKTVNKTEIEISAIFPKSAQLEVRHEADGEDIPNSSTPHGDGAGEGIDV